MTRVSFLLAAWKTETHPHERDVCGAFRFPKQYDGPEEVIRPCSVTMPVKCAYDGRSAIWATLLCVHVRTINILFRAYTIGIDPEPNITVAGMIPPVWRWHPDSTPPQCIHPNECSLCQYGTSRTSVTPSQITWTYCLSGRRQALDLPLFLVFLRASVTVHISETFFST